MASAVASEGESPAVWIERQRLVATEVCHECCQQRLAAEVAGMGANDGKPLDRQLFGKFCQGRGGVGQHQILCEPEQPGAGPAHAARRRR